MTNPTSTRTSGSSLFRRHAHWTTGLLLTLLVVAAGCSRSTRGRSFSATSVSPCTSPATFCLVSCNLGCAVPGGCSILDVPVNQDLVFQFSAPIDPASISQATASVRAASAGPAKGTWVVEGPTLRFVPSLDASDAGLFFGLRSGESYVVALSGADGSASAIQALDGTPLQTSVKCVFRASLGLVDGNGTAPFAALTQPSLPLNAPRGTAITLEFDERLDPAPFAAGGDAPILLNLRSTQPAQGVPGARVCDPNGQSIALEAQLSLVNDPLQDRATVTITPAGTLPPQACVEVQVTGLVLDLVGTSAIPATFQFVTEDDLVGPAVVFDFDSAQELDDTSSAGEVSGGFASFAQVGGDGVLGSFDPADGEEIEPGVFRFNTDSQLISAKDDSLVNQPTQVTDGIFRFSRFEVPAGTTVRFVGSNPAQILVRGDAQIDGVLDLNGGNITDDHGGTQTQGQDGAEGGAGGGRGGNGAFAGSNDGNPNQPQFNDFNGFDGESLQIQGGSPFAAHAGLTGGRGGTLHPPGNDLSVTINNPPPSPFPGQTDYIGGYAGGGGFLTPGGAGVVRGALAALTTGNSPNAIGPDGVAGGPMFALINAAQAGFSPSLDSRETLLIGGAGGGGGGSHPFISSLVAPRYWSGGGGAGGGGALGLYVGDDLTTGLGSRIEARGGSVSFTRGPQLTSAFGQAAAGGAGSGGSVLVQVSGDVSMRGFVDARGGDGALLFVAPSGPPGPGINLGFLDASSGDGGIGLLRLETEGRSAAPTEFGAAEPPVSTFNVGELANTDEVVGFQTPFVAAGPTAPNNYLRYVVDAIVDGVPMRFSDDPNEGPLAAPGQPVRFFVQGQDVDALTGQPLQGAQPSPFRQLVGAAGGRPDTLDFDRRNGFRVLILADRSFASRSIVIDKVRVEFQ